MKKLLAPTLLALCLTGCQCNEKEPGGSLLMGFKATFDGQPLVAFKNYGYAGGQKVFFSLFQYFIGNVELLRADGSAEKISDVQFVNLTVDSENEAAAGKAIQFEGIPEGEYTGIRFDIGVPEGLNSKNPNSFSSTHPLAVNGGNEFWVGWKSYIFLKIEGKYDADGDGGLFEKSLAYHCGSNEVRRTLTFDQPITVATDNPPALELTADVAKLLRENGQPLDLLAFPATSEDAGNIVVALKVVGNYNDAFKLQ